MSEKEAGEIGSQDSKSKKSILFSKKTFALVLFGTLIAGIVVGQKLGIEEANWGGYGGNWDIATKDTYELYLGRPLDDAGAKDVNRDVTVISPGTVSNYPITGGVRIKPFLISELKSDPAYKDWDVKTSSLKIAEEKINKDGWAVHQQVWPAQGPSMLPNSYFPLHLGSTFVVGDGTNHLGGFTYYELRVRQGLIYSSGELFQIDCALKEWSSCVEKKLKNALQMGPVYHNWGELGESGGTEGTVVKASIILPSP